MCSQALVMTNHPTCAIFELLCDFSSPALPSRSSALCGREGSCLWSKNIRGGIRIWTSKELHWILWIYQTNVCFLGKKMSPSKRVDDVDAFKNPIKGVWNDDGVGGHKRTEGWGFICRKVVLTYLLLRMRGGCLIRWCRYFMLHAPSFSEEPLEKKFLIYIVMVSFFIWATTTLTAWVEVQDSGTIFRIFQGWAPYKPPTHLSIYYNH